MATDLTVANEIIRQMGGSRRLATMIGASNFAGDGNSVQFSFKGYRRANKCRIILTWKDLYTMELWHFNRRTLAMEKIDEFDDLQWDMLIPTFESETGLYLTL